MVAEVEEGLEVFVGFENDVAAPSAVAAAGSAGGYVFFASEGYHAFSAVACDDLNFGLIDELHEGWSGRIDFRLYIIEDLGWETIIDFDWADGSLIEHDVDRALGANELLLVGLIALKRRSVDFDLSIANVDDPVFGDACCCVDGSFDSAIAF